MSTLSRGRKRNDERLGSSTMQLSSSVRDPTGSQPGVARALGVPTFTQGEDTSAYADTAESEDDSPPRQSVAAVRSRVQHVSCRKMCSERVPRGKAVLLIFVLLAIERYVFTGATDNALRLIPAFAGLQDDPKDVRLRYFVSLLLLYSVGRMFYPVGGFVADVFFGRYRVIHAALWLYCFAFCLLVFGLTVQAITDKAKIFSDYMVPIVSYICIVIAAGSFQAAIIPFGADQLEAASSNELSSYFYWLYFVIQVGAIGSIVVNFAVFYLLSTTLAQIMQAVISLGLISLALILHNLLKKWYFRNIIQENCIKLVIKVLWYVTTVKRQMPHYRRAFRYGEGRVPRVELAKERYDGIFTEDQVEDVKTFCRICLVLFSFCGLFFAMSAGDGLLSYRFNATLSVNTHLKVAEALIPNIFLLINTVTVALSLPLVNFVLVPCIPSLRIKEKMGIGMAILIIGIAFGAYVEWVSTDTTPLNRALYFIIPSFLLSLQEAFAFISVLEFIYAQAPESMKGMLTGICYFLLGTMSGIASVIFFFFVQHNSLLPFAFVYFYFILLVFAVLGFVAYVLVACLYTNRRRSVGDEEDEAYITLLYNTILPT